MLIKWILPKYMHFNGLKLSGALKEFSITSPFFGLKKCKNHFLEGNKNSEGIFFQIEVQMISNPSSRLEKNTKLLNFRL